MSARVRRPTPKVARTWRGAGPVGVHMNGGEAQRILVLSPQEGGGDAHEGQTWAGGTGDAL